MSHDRLTSPLSIAIISFKLIAEAFRRDLVNSIEDRRPENLLPRDVVLWIKGDEVGVFRAAILRPN